MTQEQLKKLISQIKKYDLISLFDNAEEFDKWLLSLNDLQIKNFNNLTINPIEIIFPKYLLINENLLNCADYTKRIDTISKLKNGDGCWHLFDTLCSPNFLNSKNFYQDIDLLSKADTARYGLWILAKDEFINSPYHEEDLKLLVESHDTNEENPLDYIVSEAIADVASNPDSIKSPYHQADMKLIATSGSKCLQSTHSYPQDSLNTLAINTVSLQDKYHLENMQILATNPLASTFLYEVMTTKELVKGKHYRKEIEVLLNAKSRLTARALYYYIVNPRRKFRDDRYFYDDYDALDIENAYFVRSDTVSGKSDKDYQENLTKISKIDEKFVMHFVSLLINSDFVNSPYKRFDIELLEIITNKSIFMDLYRLMTNENSLNSIHHKKDAVLISQTESEGIRDLLLEAATNEYSLNSMHHEYDMKYISKLDLDSISEKIYERMEYYLFRENGINDPNHIKILENLYKGILPEETNTNNILEHLDYLEKNMVIKKHQNDKPEEKTEIKRKILKRIKNIFKK